MLQSQHQFSSANKVKKNHSRKELLQWLCQEASVCDKSISAHFNQNSLKNGVFFLFVLQKVFPSESQVIKTKMKEKPVTEYDFEKNLLLVKKFIDKYSLPIVFEVNEILKNKGSFETLNFFKNMSDGLISPSLEQKKNVVVDKNFSPEKKFILNSGYKTNREGSSSKNNQKPASQAKSSRNYSATKNQNPFYKIKSGKNLVEIGSKELQVLDNNRSHVVAQNKLKKSTYMSQFDSLDDCNEALYELALEQNIESFKSILTKVKSNVAEVNKNASFEEYLDTIYDSIFGRKKLFE